VHSSYGRPASRQPLQYLGLILILVCLAWLAMAVFQHGTYRWQFLAVLGLGAVLGAILMRLGRQEGALHERQFREAGHAAVIMTPTAAGSPGISTAETYLNAPVETWTTSTREWTGQRVRLVVLGGVLMLAAIALALYMLTGKRQEDSFRLVIYLAIAGFAVLSSAYRGVTAQFLGPRAESDLGQQLGQYNGQLEWLNLVGTGWWALHAEGIGFYAQVRAKEAHLPFGIGQQQREFYACLPFYALQGFACKRRRKQLRITFDYLDSAQVVRVLHFGIDPSDESALGALDHALKDYRRRKGIPE